MNWKSKWEEAVVSYCICHEWLRKTTKDLRIDDVLGKISNGI